MRKLIVPLTILAMLALLGAAVAIDCVRLATAAHSRALLADGEMVKPEIKLVNLLEGSAKMSPEVQSAITALKSIHSRQARMDAYTALVSSFHKTMSGAIDPTNQTDRKFMDDVAGAINRHNVAEKQYEEESTAYQNYLKSWRGSVARLFSSQARSDWKQAP